MKNIKLLIVILIVAFSAFNISMSITENSENNITLNSINEHAFASSENECSNAISMTFGCTRCSNMNVPGCKHIPEETTSTCTIGKCSQCGLLVLILTNFSRDCLKSQNIPS